eukprot:3557635-Rhodomonas_salina.1
MAAGFFGLLQTELPGNARSSPAIIHDDPAIIHDNSAIIHDDRDLPHVTLRASWLRTAPWTCARKSARFAVDLYQEVLESWLMADGFGVRLYQEVQPGRDGAPQLCGG